MTQLSLYKLPLRDDTIKIYTFLSFVTILQMDARPFCMLLERHVLTLHDEGGVSLKHSQGYSLSVSVYCCLPLNGDAPAACRTSNTPHYFSSRRGSVQKYMMISVISVAGRLVLGSAAREVFK